MPAWVQEGGIEPTVDRLSDRRVRDRLNAEWFSAPTPYALENITIAMVANPDWRWAEGHDRHARRPRRRGSTPGDFVCDILAASDMAVGIVAFRPGDRTEDDVRAILRHPAHMAGSDGIFRGGFPHPRGWGAFARYLGYHTRELGDYSWPEAVTHLATHAARRFRLTDRGLIRPGFVADIAVLDPATVTDRSTYAAGRTLAEGVEHVLVNGTFWLWKTASPPARRPGGRCGGGERQSGRPRLREGESIAWSANDFQLGHLGRLDVLDADLGGELLDDAQQIGPGRRAREQGVFHLALVAALAEEDVERDLAEEGNAHRFGLAPGAAAAEDVDPLVAGRVEEALGVDQLVRLRPAAVAQVGDDVEERHVLDHPQHGHFQLAEHA